MPSPRHLITRSVPGWGSNTAQVICQKLAGADLPQLAEERLLLPCNFTVGNLTTFIRSHIKISPEKSIFLFVNNTLLPAHQELLTVYKERHDLDGFLYILYSGENSFGQRDESTIG